MTYIPVTPFRRTLDAAVLKHHANTQQDLPPSGVNKWEILRELAIARTAFDLSDRDISVLQALISFHQATLLGGNESDLVVYPSNKSICERLNGMPCSTMRRHLGRLVQVGLLVRRDSPNGKRYARRYGTEKTAFGFDLSPLVQRANEIRDAAETIRAAQEQYKRLRETVSLMRRDLAGLAVYGADMRPDLSVWDQFSDLAILTARDLRRKLTHEALAEIQNRLEVALTAARDILEPQETVNLSTTESLSEQHHQNSNEDSYESEQPNITTHIAQVPRASQNKEDIKARPALTDNEPDHNLPRIPLSMVLTTCTELQTYAQGPIRHWHDLVRVAETLCPMMDISPTAWDAAKAAMGPEEAAVVVVSMLERFETIRSPGGYLRTLTAKAAIGTFSCGPMIMALMRRDTA
jgi:replication initiation protein RepC